jgi:hypothetical protein
MNPKFNSSSPSLETKDWRLREAKMLEELRAEATQEQAERDKSRKHKHGGGMREIAKAYVSERKAESDTLKALQQLPKLVKERNDAAQKNMGQLGIVVQRQKAESQSPDVEPQAWC